MFAAACSSGACTATAMPSATLPGVTVLSACPGGSGPAWVSLSGVVVPDASFATMKGPTPLGLGPRVAAEAVAATGGDLHGGLGGLCHPPVSVGAHRAVSPSVCFGVALPGCVCLRRTRCASART